jgi:hypothetical protein
VVTAAGDAHDARARQRAHLRMHDARPHAEGQRR